MAHVITTGLTHITGHEMSLRLPEATTLGQQKNKKNKVPQDCIEKKLVLHATAKSDQTVLL